LEPKAIELLLFLAQNPARLVTKAEIQEAVWADTAVTENALTRLVAQIRKGLGDGAREARYIETVPTRGYRFVATLQPTGEAPDSARGGAHASVDAPGPASASAASSGTARWVRAAAATALLAFALAGAYLLWTPRPSSRNSSPTNTRAMERQVSTSATLNAFPSFSPDGSTIAFATLRRGSMEIVVRALALGAREQAVTDDGMQNVQPAYSPDGRLIAYHTLGRGGIWLVPALGGVPRQLTTFGSSPAWSPDGSTIAFQSQAWIGSSAGHAAAGEGSTLWLVASSGGEPRRLTSIEAVGPGGQGSPSWSPTGRLIAFMAGTRVFAVRPDGTGLRQTSRTVWARDVWGRDVVWEKGGRSQLWLGVRQGNWFLWRVTVDPETGEPSGEPEVLAGGGDKDNARAQAALSPDGLTLAYVTFRTQYEILAQAVSPSGEPVGKPVAMVRTIQGRKTPPIFSPDGRSLAFGTVRPGVGPALWVAPLDAGEPRLLAEQPGVRWCPAWFPGSRRLGLVGEGAKGHTFQSLDVETGTIRHQRDLEPHISSAPALSPDGTTLVAHGTRKGSLNVWVMDLADGPARPLTDDREGVGWPVWSPDGKSLAVEVMRGGDTQVAIMPASGGPLRQLTSAPGQSWPHSFSPDGRKVAFAGQRNGIWNIYWVGVGGGDERTMTSYTSPALYVRYPDWSPRGDRVAYEFAESTSTVWVTELPPAATPR
jgi:Tol biopolymer transport system component/DNA-binding winged helix-turn-helix (wHTH) protein